jgi:uncharacterized membrane protein YbhN (UPF0104 family)
MKRLRLALLLALKAGLSALLLTLVLHRVNFGEIAHQLRHANLLLVAAALLPATATVLLLAWRWQQLSCGLLTFGQALRYTFVGIFYGALLPGGLTGDIAKGTAVAWKNRSARVAALPVSIIADRLVGLYALLALFGVSCAVLAVRAAGAGLRDLGLVGAGVSAGALVAGPLLLTNRGRTLLTWLAARLPVVFVRDFAVRCFDLMAQPRGGRAWVFLLGLSLLIHVLNVTQYGLLLAALGAKLSVFQLTAFYSILSVLVMVPISISGIGVRDWFALHFAATVGLASGVGVAWSWLLLGLTWLLAATGGLAQLWEAFAPRSQERPPGDGSSDRPAS